MAFTISFMFDGSFPVTIGNTEDGTLADVELTQSATSSASLKFTLYSDNTRGMWDVFNLNNSTRTMRVMGTFDESDPSYNTTYYDFVGTVIDVVQGMDSDGLPYRTVTCESLDAGLNELYIHTDITGDTSSAWYTGGNVNSDGSVTISVFDLQVAIDAGGAESWSWNVPQVHFRNYADTENLRITVEPEHRACVADLISDILDTHNLEIQYGVLRESGWSGSYVEIEGAVQNKKAIATRGTIEVGVNMLECELEVDMSDIITVLRPYGDTYERSYTSNSGAEYVQNVPIATGYFISEGHLTKNTDTYGVIPAVYQITGVVDTTDENYFTDGVFDPTKLTDTDKASYTDQAQAYLDEHCEPAVEISVDGYDLSLLEDWRNSPLPYQWWNISNPYCWSNPDSYLVEVIERTWDFNNPERMTLKLGNAKKTATNTNAKTRRTATSAQATATSASSNAQSAYRQSSTAYSTANSAYTGAERAYDKADTALNTVNNLNSETWTFLMKDDGTTVTKNVVVK